MDTVGQRHADQEDCRMLHSGGNPNDRTLSPPVRERLCATAISDAKCPKWVHFRTASSKSRHVACAPESGSKISRRGPHRRLASLDGLGALGRAALTLCRG